MRLKVTTWNVNSVRLRLPTLLKFLAVVRPEVLCLQETKVGDEKFPLEPIADAGYVHTHIHGMKAYNGVAILSRLPLENRAIMGWCERADCRHASAVVAGIEIHNLYVPAGGDTPDPEDNPKFAHKLQFLDETTAWFAAARDAGRAMMLVGDLNIAPLETDVWSHRQLLSVVSHTPVEVERLARLQEAAAWVDAVRHFVPAERKLYSWWSYRNRDWAASDRGRRLDHIWVTPPLVPRLVAADIAREVRGWTPPSDHVPVTVELEIDG